MNLFQWKIKSTFAQFCLACTNNCKNLYIGNFRKVHSSIYIVKSCHNCRFNKNSRLKMSGKLLMKNKNKKTIAHNFPNIFFFFFNKKLNWSITSNTWLAGPREAGMGINYFWKVKVRFVHVPKCWPINPTTEAKWNHATAKWKHIIHFICSIDLRFRNLSTNIYKPKWYS